MNEAIAYSDLAALYAILDNQRLMLEGMAPAGSAQVTQLRILARQNADALALALKVRDSSPIIETF